MRSCRQVPESGKMRPCSTQDWDIRVHTRKRRRGLVGTLAFVLVCVAALFADNPGLEDWEEGRRLFGIEEYRRAQESFERALSKNPLSSTYNFWLGLAIGRRAEGMTGFRRLGAIGLAKKVKVQFERAVELDGSNLDALEALQTFHFQAPAFVGGNKAEARRIADRIKQIDEERGAIAWAACFEKDKDFASAAVQYALARELAPEQHRLLGGTRRLPFQTRPTRGKRRALQRRVRPRSRQPRALAGCGQSLDQRQALLSVSQSETAAGTLSREREIGAEQRLPVPDPQDAEKGNLVFKLTGGVSEGFESLGSGLLPSSNETTSLKGTSAISGVWSLSLMVNFLFLSCVLHSLPPLDLQHL